MTDLVEMRIFEKHLDRIEETLMSQLAVLQIINHYLTLLCNKQGIATITIEKFLEENTIPFGTNGVQG